MADKTNSIKDLRIMLFTTLERLLDKEDSMDAAQAKAAANLGRVIVDSAKTEVDVMKLLGGTGSGFIPVSFTSSAPELTN
jgi:hypothetical protein